MSYDPAYRRPALSTSSHKVALAPVPNKRGKDEWIINQIVDAKSVKGKRFYKVRWLGFGEKGDTWESRHTLRGCRALARWEYAQSQPVTEYRDGKKITRRYVSDFPPFL